MPHDRRGAYHFLSSAASSPARVFSMSAITNSSCSRSRLLRAPAAPSDGGPRCIIDVCAMSLGFAGDWVDDSAKSTGSRRGNPKWPALDANLTIGQVR